MIYAIILVAAGVTVALLSIIAGRAILVSMAATRSKERALHELEAALAGKEALKAENSRLRQANTDLGEALENTRLLYNSRLAECKELKARNADLEEALAAKPTQAKRIVRKNGMKATEQEEA